MGKREVGFIEFQILPCFGQTASSGLGVLGVFCLGDVVSQVELRFGGYCAEKVNSDNNVPQHTSLSTGVLGALAV